MSFNHISSQITEMGFSFNRIIPKEANTKIICRSKVSHSNRYLLTLGKLINSKFSSSQYWDNNELIVSSMCVNVFRVFLE